MSIPMSLSLGANGPGRLTVQTSHSDLGAFRADTFRFLEKIQKDFSSLVGGLARIGFTLANMIVLSVSLNFGRGLTVSSVMTLEPFPEPPTACPPDDLIGALPHYQVMINTFVTHIQNAFSLLVNGLRGDGVLGSQAVVCFSMDLKLSVRRQITITVTSEGEPDFEEREVAPESDNNSEAPPAPPSTGDHGSAPNGQAGPYPGSVHPRGMLGGVMDGDLVAWQPVRRGDSNEFWLNCGFRRTIR